LQLVGGAVSQGQVNLVDASTARTHPFIRLAKNAIASTSSPSLAVTMYRGYHALRHSAGTRLTREGASLEDVARHLGHAALETARSYAKWSDHALRQRMAQ